MRLFALACCAAAVAAETVGDVDFTSLGKFSIEKPSFMRAAKWVDFYSTSDPFLYVTSHSLSTGEGSISIVPGLKEAVAAGDVSTLKATKLDTGDSLNAPMHPSMAPAIAFEANRVIAVPNGYQGSGNGGVYLVHVSSDDMTKTLGTYKMTPDKEGYFYNMGQWVDLNGDGLLDYITARSNGKAGEGELVWFERPSGSFGLDGKEWTEHLITMGPDTAFEIDRLDAYPHEIIVWAAQSADNKLSLYRVSTKTGFLVDSRVIDDSTILAANSVSMVDLNGDGKNELLISSQEQGSSKSGILALTVPEDIMTGTFESFTLADGFTFHTGRGYPYAVHPDGQTSERSHVLVAGATDDAAFLLTPTGDAAKFEYEKDLIVKEGGDVGSLATYDVDGDGWLEMFVPDYTDGSIEIFKMSAPATPTEFLQ